MKNKKSIILKEKFKILFDIRAYHKERVLEQYTKKDVKLILGENTFIKDFDHLLIDREIILGESFTIDKKFVKNFLIKAFQNKTITFSITIVKCKKFTIKDKLNELKNENKELKEFLKTWTLKYSNLMIENSKLKLENAKIYDQFNEKAASLNGQVNDKVNEFKEKHKAKTNEEISEIKKYASQNLVADLLSLIKNLDLAIKAGSNSDNSQVQAYNVGFNMILNNIYNSLGDYGVIKIEPQENEEFNPILHHLFHVEKNKKVKSNRIIKTNSIGYKFHDRIIIPAQVTVSK